jgi:hypothetical protein
MKKFALSLVLMLGLLPAVALAQDATETTSAGLPALAGKYSVTQSFGGQSVGGDVTFEGTGPIYWASYKGEDGTVGGPTPTLRQGDVVIIPSGADCYPAALLRQDDGTLFGHWIDISVSESSLGFEYMKPTAPTTDFVGTYDLVGSYATGGQYTGTVKITRDAGGIYTAVYSYTSDNTEPDFAPSDSTFKAIANGNVLGSGFNAVSDASCAVLVLKQAMDGSLSGEFTASDTEVGKAEGKPE